jgi:flagellar motor component MotA
MLMQLLSSIERKARRDSRSQIEQEGTELEMKFLEQYLEIKICY